jgi:hypothetical protein
MKMFAGFLVGVICGLLIVFFVFRNTAPVAADSKAVAYAPAGAVSAADDGTTTTTDISTDGTDYSGMLPDVKKIYSNAIGVPYRQVGAEITDPDIAKFWRAYMDATGLDKAGLNP